MMRTSLVVITLVLSLASPVEAQDSSGPRPMWLTLGLGGGAYGGLNPEGFVTSHAYHGLATLIQGSYQDGPHLLSFRAGSVLSSLSDYWADLGFLYGRATSGGGRRASISAGLSWVRVKECDEIALIQIGPCVSESTIGVPIVAEGALTLSGSLGIGLQVFGNVNSSHSAVGGALVLHVGRLE